MDCNESHLHPQCEAPTMTQQQQQQQQKKGNLKMLVRTLTIELALNIRAGLQQQHNHDDDDDVNNNNNNNMIESFSITNCQFEDGAFSILADTITYQCPNMKYVSLFSCALSDDDISYLINNMIDQQQQSCNNNISVLDLGKNQCSYKTMIALQHLLSNQDCCSLQRLNLAYQQRSMTDSSFSCMNIQPITML